jgi:CheY-like chemotaxis protein/two-component sensor histidine kinase
MAMSEQDQAQPSGSEVERFSALGQIAGELIHDLANVVAVVHGRASLALGDARTGRPPTAELERLVEASEDMSGMLRDVLEILRGSQLSPEVRFDPVRVIERSVRRFLDSAPSLEIRLVSTLPAGAVVPGRASFLARAVLNLLNNAARYARSEIRLTIGACEANPAEIELLIEDDGPGIAPSMVSGIFRPLVRGDGGGAAGLGLSSVSWAVQQLGGEVRYRSDCRLGGAAFEIRIPAIHPRPPQTIPNIDVLKGCRIALLEDDATIQRAIGKLLGRMGAEITAFNPVGAGEEEILQALLTATPDVILLGLRLGNRDGGEVWRALESNVPALARRVVFLSALGRGDREWDEARATGQPVLAKPLDIGELTTVLDALLDSQ